MKRYAVITTPHCTRCLVLKRLVQAKGLAEQFEFLPSTSSDGRELLRRHAIRAGGVIVDREQNRIVEFTEIGGTESV